MITKAEKRASIRVWLAKNYWTSERVQEATRVWGTESRKTPHQEELRDHFNIPRTMKPSDDIVILPLAKITGPCVVVRVFCVIIRVLTCGSSLGHLDTWTHHGSPRHLGIPRQTRQSKAVRWEASTTIIVIIHHGSWHQSYLWDYLENDWVM